MAAKIAPRDGRSTPQVQKPNKALLTVFHTFRNEEKFEKTRRKKKERAAQSEGAEGSVLSAITA
jgi:hypothetical protein